MSVRFTKDHGDTPQFTTIEVWKEHAELCLVQTGTTYHQENIIQRFGVVMASVPGAALLLEGKMNSQEDFLQEKVRGLCGSWRSVDVGWCSRTMIWNIDLNQCRMNYKKNGERTSGDLFTPNTMRICSSWSSSVRKIGLKFLLNVSSAAIGNTRLRFCWRKINSLNPSTFYTALGI